MSGKQHARVGRNDFFICISPERKFLEPVLSRLGMVDTSTDDRVITVLYRKCSKIAVGTAHSRREISTVILVLSFAMFLTLLNTTSLT